MKANLQRQSNYFSDCLWVVFSVLDDSLPGCKTAVYLRAGQGGDYILQKSSVTRKTFVKSISPKLVSRLLPGRDNDGPGAGRVASLKIKEQILEASSQDSDVIVNPIFADDDQAGLLVVKLAARSPEDGQTLKSIDMAARIMQSCLVLKSEVELLHHENAFLTNLVSQTETLDISSTSETLVDTLVRLVKGVLSYDRLTISTQTTEIRDGLTIDSVNGLKGNYSPGFTYAGAGVLHGEVFRQAAPLRIGCMEESEFSGRFVAGDFKKTRLTSFLGVPILEAGVPKGVLALESKARNHFGAGDQDILKAIVQVYGPAMCWTQRYREVHDRATVDGLTQLLNHRSLLERLGEELERANRYGETMNFLMLDLDNFKRVNDNHGHLFGDYVLWETAQLIRSCVRKVDITGRYGGEEFGVIIINASKKDSLSTAERIRSTIAKHRFKNNGARCRVSVSIGMSEYPEDGQDINTLIQRADDAMYMIKRQGGNGVMSYSEQVDDRK